MNKENAAAPSPIEHVVVLMLENRSFDNLLGWLYDAQNSPPFDKLPSGQSFEGLNNSPPKNWWNNQWWPPAHGTDSTEPHPDPNELYANMYVQMYNPASYSTSDPVPDPPTAPASMQGYMADYATVKGAQVPDIMDCFRPADVPVISMLAYWYGVCDHWYAPVPSQTFTNRSFVHAGTASGYVDNLIGKHAWDIWTNDTPTIFNLLQAAGQSWRIYYGGWSLLCQAGMCQNYLGDYLRDGTDPHLFPIAQFYEDVKDAANFPSYVFIEPNFIGNPIFGPENDEHPQAAPLEFEGPSNVLYGEELIASVFNALTSNQALWQSTMFVLLFDECGGTYDHYAPQPATATPPDGVVIAEHYPGYSGFKFDRYGARVPAIVCSPYTPKSIVCNSVFDHTSVIRTVSNLFLGGKVTLGARDANANDLSGLVSLEAPRTDLPTLTPRKPPSFDATELAGAPLTDFQRALVGAALSQAARRRPEAFAALGTPRVETHADAWRIAAALEGKT